MILYSVLFSSFVVFLANGQTSPSYHCKVRKGREPNVKDSSCETFYACSEFAGQIRKCRGGQQFHFEALECKPDEEVWCNDQRSNIQTTTTPAPTTAAVTTPAPTTAAATTAAATTAAATTAAPVPAADDGIGALLGALFPQLNTIPGIGNLIPGLGGQQAVPNALDFGAQVPVGVAPGAVGGNVDPLGGGVAGPFGLRGVLPDAGDQNGVDGGTIVITPDDGDGPIVIQAVVPNPNADALPPGQVPGAGNGVGLGQGADQDRGVSGVGNDANGQYGSFAGLPGGQGGVVNGGGVGNSFNVPQGQTFSNANIPQFPQNSPNNVNQDQGQARPPNTQGQSQPSFGQGPVIPGQTQSNPNSTIPRLVPGSFSPTQGQIPFSPSQGPSQSSPNQGSGKIPTLGQNPLNPGLSDSDQKPPQHYAPAAFFPQVIIPAAASPNGQAVTTLSDRDSQNLVVNVGQRKLQSIREEEEDAPDVDAGSEMVQSRFRRSLGDNSYRRNDGSEASYNKDQQRDTAGSSNILDGMSFVSNALSVANSVLSDILPKEAQESSSANSDLNHQTVDKGSATSETHTGDFLDLEKSFTQIGDAVLDAFSSVVNLLHNVDSGDAFHTLSSSPTPTPSKNPVDLFLKLGHGESSVVSHDSTNGNSQVLGEMKLQGQGGHNGNVLAHGQIAKISGNDTFSGDSPPHGYAGGNSLPPQNDIGLETSTGSNGSRSGIVDLNANQQNSVVPDSNDTVTICKNNTVSANQNKADSYTATNAMNSTSLKKISSVNNWLKIEIDVPVESDVDNDTASGSTTHTHKEWSLTLTFGDENSQDTSSSQNHIKVHSSSGTDDSDNGQGNSISNTFNHHFTFSNSHHSSSSSSSSNEIPSNSGGSNGFHNTNSQPGQSFYPDINSGQFQNPFNPYGDSGLGGIPVYPFGGGNGIQSQESGNGNHGSIFSPLGGNQGNNFQGPQSGTSSNFPGGAFPWGQMG